MDFLDKQEKKREKSEYINRLKRRKQALKDRLQKLNNCNFDIQNDRRNDSKLQQDVSQCMEILDSYRLLGVSIKSMGPDLVLRFDPLYKNQYPTTDNFSVQLFNKGDNYELRRHNLPPFIPLSVLNVKLLEDGLSVFVEEVRVLLYAYIQRREGFSAVQKAYKKYIVREIDVNLSVSYVKFELDTDDDFPDISVTLQYDLRRCLPETVEIIPVMDAKERTSRKLVKQKLSEWQQTLSEQEIFEAFSDITLNISSHHQST